MAGKLTPDDMMSASRLPGLLGFSKYSTPNDELQFSINALMGKERPDISNESMHWGNTLEPVILREAAARLMIEEFDTSIQEAFFSDSIPLSCSLDGIAYGKGQVIKPDHAAGIYVVGQDEIVLDGPGVLEAKLTRISAEDTPDLARGPIQLQGQMLVTGYKWGAVCVLYAGTELRVFLFSTHHESQKTIIKACLEFQHKLDKFKAKNEIDWYAPTDTKDLDRMFPSANDETVDMGIATEQYARQINECKSQIKLLEADIAKAEIALKEKMGFASKGVAGRYLISWPMRTYKAQPEKITPAKDAYTIRQSTLTIKENKS